MGASLINNRYALTPNPKQSGMSEVYKAADMHNDMQQVAVKIFTKGRIEEEISAESFRREINALKELKHDHIVKLIDSGIDRETGHNFLVLEWMKKNLLEKLKESPLDGWDSFWQEIGKPLLEALAFCHNREYIHRDIKPENILINNEGTIKLADFGISKLRSYLVPTVTLREFVSRPYTPPEYDDGSYTYTRDVFSFGVVALKCLTDVTIIDYDNIDKAIKELDAPSEIIRIINRSISDDPEERQQNAEVLLSEINAFQQKRDRSFIKKTQKCYLMLRENFDNIASELKANSLREIQKIILEDLNNDCGIKRYKQKNSNNYEEDQYLIFGSAYSYRVKINKTNREKLIFLSAMNLSNDVLEKNRQEGWNPNYEFTFEQNFPKHQGQDLINELQLSVEEYEATIRQKQAEDEKQRLFRTWENILKLKIEWEKKRQPLLIYTEVRQDGNRAIFTLESVPDENLVEQTRHVTLDNGYSLLGGNVEEIKEDQLILYLNYGDVQRIPKRGVLKFDTRANEYALNQQKYAVDAIKYDRAVRSDLRNLLVNPQNVILPDLDENIQFIQSLNESQKEIVKAALGTKDFLVIEGPPGTGKTTFITELILQTLQQNPDAKILLTSQTHVALDNALERIQKVNNSLKIVRIGNHEKVADNVHDLLFEEQMDQWKREVLERSKDFINDWSNEHNLDKKDLEMATYFQKLKNIASQINSLKQEIESLKQEKYELTQQREYLPYFENYDFNNPNAKLPINLPQDVKDQIKYLDNKIKEYEKKAKSIRQDEQKPAALELQNLSGFDIEEISKMSIDDLESYESMLADPNNTQAKQLKKLMRIQQDWFDIFGQSNSDRFNSALVKRCQIVAGTCIGLAQKISDGIFDLCIIDEASKATATELLVPISRSKKWILVGDTKQLAPFQDQASRDQKLLDQYNLNSEEVKETLFAYLLRTLPEANRTLLNIQHRMVKPIGDLISECFYNSQIQSARDDLDNDLINVIPKHITWITTSKLSNCSEQLANKSYNNIAEVEIIVDHLKRLNQMAINTNKNYTIAILTGYSAQLKLLTRKLESELSNWEGLSIIWNTVDAFQGQEADIVIYSITRSNKQANLGFLNDDARMNVALSRGKVGLIIVGDHNFCRSLTYNPLKTVLEYIESHPKTCCLQEAK